MKSKRQLTKSGLRAVGGAIDVLSVVSDQPHVSTRGLRSVIVMMAIAMVGVVIWFGAFIVAGLIIVVFGLAQGPYTAIGSAVGIVGVVGGLAAAAFVMFRIIRRHRRLVAFAGFEAEPDDVDASNLVAAEASRKPISPSELRTLDARLAEDTRSDGDANRT